MTGSALIDLSEILSIVESVLGVDRAILEPLIFGHGSALRWFICLRSV